MVGGLSMASFICQAVAGLRTSAAEGCRPPGSHQASFLHLAVRIPKLVRVAVAQPPRPSLTIVTASLSSHLIS